MPESKLPLCRWTRTKHDQMTDYLDQKLTEGCAASVMKVPDEENQWVVNFQSCTINLATTNPNSEFGGQIRPDARPQFQEDVQELIEKMRVAGIDSPQETLPCDAVRRNGDTGEFAVLPTGAQSVKTGWKILSKGSSQDLKKDISDVPQAEPGSGLCLRNILHQHAARLLDIPGYQLGFLNVRGGRAYKWLSCERKFRAKLGRCAFCANS